jgi:hypothetical protein
VIVSIRQGKAAEMNAWSVAENGSRFDAEEIRQTEADGGA